ncbi:MAG TPA: glycosyltransferase [Solirubrobacteraceae bacterium]|nr:glycosyltransferase [Solirubrobacteraceae bacterium]
MTIPATAPERFASVLSPGEYEALLDLVDHAARELHGRVIWNVNSTAKGGGVVEMLRPLLGYCRGAGVDARWAVISGQPEFFAITKRIHNRLHGFPGDGGPLGDAEREVYEKTLAASADELAKLVHPRDIVILHDPQTAGAAAAVRETGATVMWRCHVGLDVVNDHARGAWDFLRGYVSDAHLFIFSRAGYAWEGLPRDRTSVIRPSIDAFAPKNAEQAREQSLSILATAGVLAAEADAYPMFTRSDGTPGRVERRAEMLEEAPLVADVPVVMQVSRWDQLKDPLGVLGAFAGHVANRGDAHLLLAGPSTAAVADDPEGAQVLDGVRAAWHELPARVRRRVHLCSLPMDDIEENAAIVNALQRHASVVVQKSLAEGFGLTVAEAMWKQRPVVASRIGGIRDQIEDGRSGVLLSDPRDLQQVGAAVRELLANRERAQSIGIAAQRRVQEQFLGPHHLGRYFEVMQRVAAQRRVEARGFTR